MRASNEAIGRARAAASAAFAAAASGALLALAYPSADQGWLAWFALIPLVVALRGSGVGRAFALGLVFAIVAEVGIFGWLFVVPGITIPRFAALALYVAAYPVAWCAGVVLLERARVPLVWSAPALWVALEALRAHAGFLSLTWATIAQTQHADVPLLQLAAWTGEAGVSFVVVLVNVIVARLIGRSGMPHARRAVSITACCIVALHLGGLARLAAREPGASVRVAAVQPHIGSGERATPDGRAAVWTRLAVATRRADAGGAELVVWPETAVGDPRHDPALAADLGRLSSSIDAAIVTGAAETEKFARGDGAAMTFGQRPKFNSALLVERGAIVGEPYRKRVLLPFGEYLPLRGALAWPAWLVPGDIVDGTAGDDGRPFIVARRLRVAILICWENAFADLTRRAVEDGAQLVAHLANDAWFGNTRAAAQHDAISVMRAVENGVPIVVASNDGPSEIVDARGRVVVRIDRDSPFDVAAATLAIGPAGTFYSRHGDVFAALCVVVLVAASVLAVVRRASRRAAHPHRSLMETS